MAQGGITNPVPRIIRCEGGSHLSAAGCQQQREPKGAVRASPLAMAIGACVCSCEFVCLREEKEAMLHFTAGTGIVKACASSNDLIIIIKIIIGNGGG